MTCRKEVEEPNAALVCDRWEHVAYIRQCDKLSEALYTALVDCCTKAIMYVCSMCRREGSIAKKLLRYEVDCARANDEQLASTRQLAKRDLIIGELRSDKQQLIECSTALEKEVSKLRDKLAKVSVRSESRVTESESDDVPQLESASEYPSDSVSELQPLQRQQVNRRTDLHPISQHNSKRHSVDPHPPGFRALCT